MPASPLAPHPHEGAAALLWKGWQPSPGISGSFRVESVAGLLWNQWQLWRGIRSGRCQVEHERFSLCYSHYEDRHGGPWESCQKCRDFWSPRDYKIYAENPINWPRY